MKILAIESSCDETAAAVVENGVKILSTVVATSTTFHEKYGGILPELAARKQLDFIIPVISKSLIDAFPLYTPESLIDCIKNEVDAIAVTIGPGLIGSLLIGVEAAKTLSFLTNKPLIPVNHVHAHIYANFIETISIQFPSMALVVSGGHTELFYLKSIREIEWLGGTIDDAAGEAFDKTARLLGFGNKGGKAIENAAKEHFNMNPSIDIHLPRPLLHDGTMNFSFSGLKTAIQRGWNSHEVHSKQLVCAFAHEVQEAITDVLVKKTIIAAQQKECRSILLAGGVAANVRLREKFVDTIHTKRLPFSFFSPPTELCTDNAVTIATYAFYKGKPDTWEEMKPIPNLSAETTTR